VHAIRRTTNDRALVRLVRLRQRVVRALAVEGERRVASGAAAALGRDVDGRLAVATARLIVLGPLGRCGDARVGRQVAPGVTLGAVGGDKRGSERGGGGSSEQREALHCVSVTGEGGGCPVGRGIGNERSEAPRPAGKHADLNAMTRAWKARTARSHDGDGPSVSSQMGFALRKL
jgi:hypothetical protein